jgi:hypothetical protein
MLNRGEPTEGRYGEELLEPYEESGEESDLGLDEEWYESGWGVGF